MAAIGPNPLEVVLMLLLGGGFGLPSGIPPAAEDPLAQKIAPAECLAYASWAATGTPNAASGNHTEQLLAEPEVQKFLNRAGDSFFNAVQQIQRDPDAQEANENFKKVLKLIQGKAGAVYISDVQIQGNEPPKITGGGLLQVGEDGPALETILLALQSKLGPGKVSDVQIANRTFHRVNLSEDAPAVTWGLAGNYLVFGIGDGALDALLQRARSAEPAWLTSAKTNLAVPRVSSLMYVNVNKIVDIAMTASGDPNAQRVVSALGFDKLGAMVIVNGLDDQGCVMRSELSFEGAPTGILTLLDSQPLNPQDLALIAKGSPAALVFKLDGAKVYDLVLDLSRQFNASDDLTDGLEMLRQRTGIALRDDVLAALGDTWRIYAPPGPAGLTTGWTIAVKVRDRKKLERVQEILVALAQQELGRAGEGAPTIQSSQVAGHTVHSLVLGQPGFSAAPSWCITDDELFVTVTLQELERILAKNRPTESLAEHAGVQKLFQADAGLLSLAYLDTRQIAETLLPLAPLGLRLATGQQLPSTAGLPPQEAILPHLQPSLLAVQRTARGVGITGQQTLPGGNVGASAPAMIAFLLPAVQASRSAAQRMQGANNLKQIALSLHNFHDTYRAFPAGYSADADGNPLLSWRVHVLPFLEQQVLYDQFHLDEPWDSPHNKKLIARMPQVYRHPSSKAEPGMTNYLGVAGKDGVFVRPQAGDRLGTRFAEMLDGTSNTIMTVEVPDESAVIWTKPGDYSPNLDDPMKGLMGLYPGGFQVGFGDGSVRFLSEMIAPETLRGAFTKSGGERIDIP